MPGPGMRNVYIPITFTIQNLQPVTRLQIRERKAKLTRSDRGCVSKVRDWPQMWLRFGGGRLYPSNLSHPQSHCVMDWRIEATVLLSARLLSKKCPTQRQDILHERTCGRMP